ncbi:hypothetical protein Pan181_51830 [Aeoliella mucimassa]|uniref:Sialate O-acetylesterase domain-containing protein n=1 Tax=Aeoliella mucimassa TaxID=2527972 RepID=A0A518AW43_9BACT|nr:hypothetical protein Pan181_51830 [Aeoliella mucimassa]
MQVALVAAACLLATGLSAQASADEGLKFASPFSSGMVLQRDQPITVAGRAAAGADVALQLGEQHRTAKVNSTGNWQVVFDSLPAGGPYELTAKQGDHQQTLSDVLIGDVWLFSGQSNMQMPVREAEGGADEISNADANLSIRLLMVPKSGADQPRDELNASWQHCTPDAVRQFSAVGWFFAKHLRSSAISPDVPLGLIDSSFGGTTVEGWTPAGQLPDIPEQKIRVSMFDMPASHLFNGMIAPLQSYRLKGAVWYQGESNAGAPDVYATLLSNMMQQWRKSFHDAKLPFFVVQLPAYEGRMEGLDYSWLREAEQQACLATDRAWLAVTYDTNPGFDLHPRKKAEIGRRLALLAGREVYGQRVVAHSPQVESVEYRGNQVVVTFDQQISTPAGEPVEGCWIASDPGDYFTAEGSIEGRQLVLQTTKVSQPTAVRIAWGSMPTTNLYNEARLPVVPYRSDQRAADSLAFQPLPTSYRIETSTYALELGRGGSITSLIAGGHQWMSNEPGGGTSIPNMFGPRNLAYVKELGPGRLLAEDDAVHLELVAREQTMEWNVGHHGQEDLEFRMALSPAVQVELQGSTAVLTRDGFQIRIEGVERCDGSHTLVAKIPARDTNTLRLTFAKP